MIQINSKTLTKAIQLAGSALPSVAIVPVMEYVKLEIMGRIAHVTGIGGEMGVRAGIKPDEYGGSGEVLLPANLVLSAIEELDTMLTVKKDSVAWDSGRLTFGATNDPYSDFSMETGSVSVFNGPDLAQALSKISPMLDTTVEMSMDAYAWIHGSHVFGGGHNSIGRIEIEKEGSDITLAISKGMCSKVIKLLKECPVVNVSRSKSTVYFSSEWLDWSISQPEMTMRNYTALFEKLDADPGYFDSCVNCKGLKSLVSSIESTFGHCSISLNSVGDILTVTFQETMGGRSMVQSLPMNPGAQDWNIMFSSSFLGKQLAMCDKLFIKNEKSAVRTSGPGYKGLVMPQYIK